MRYDLSPATPSQILANYLPFEGPSLTDLNMQFVSIVRWAN